MARPAPLSSRRTHLRAGAAAARPGESPLRRSPLRFAAAVGLSLVAALGCAAPGGSRPRVDARGCSEASGSESCAADGGRAIAELRAQVARLEAIHEIERLKARFMRCIDTKNLVCLRDEVFAPGAEIRFKGADYDITAAGWTQIEQFYQGAFTTAKFGMHHAHTPEIEVDGETARGKWYLHDVFVNLEDDTTLQGSALYDESYAKLDGRWRIMFSTYERLWEETTPRDPRTKLGSRPVKEPVKE